MGNKYVLTHINASSCKYLARRKGATMPVWVQAQWHFARIEIWQIAELDQEEQNGLCHYRTRCSWQHGNETWDLLVYGLGYAKW